MPQFIPPTAGLPALYAATATLTATSAVIATNGDAIFCNRPSNGEILFYGADLATLTINADSTLYSINTVNASNLTTITINPTPDWPALSTVEASGCALSSDTIDALVAACIAGGQTNGTLDVSGGTSSGPGTAGAAGITVLQSSGWLVYAN